MWRYRFVDSAKVNTGGKLKHVIRAWRLLTCHTILSHCMSFFIGQMLTRCPPLMTKDMHRDTWGVTSSKTEVREVIQNTEAIIWSCDMISWGEESRVLVVIELGIQGWIKFSSQCFNLLVCFEKVVCRVVKQKVSFFFTCDFHSIIII